MTLELTRRHFVVGGLAVSAAVPLSSFGFDRRSRAGAGERALVVVQLSGGNDGLNLVAPRRQDAYFRLRPTLALAPGAVHALDDDFGLHPVMGALAERYRASQVAIVHGVGYPAPDRSHFRSMEIWHTADPEHPPRGLGWMGRIAEEFARRDPTCMPALHVGDGELPLCLAARTSFTPSVRDPRGFELHRFDASIAAPRAKLLEGRASGELAFLRDAARATYRAVERMSALAEQKSAVEYPGYALAQELALVARLIVGGFGTRLFHVELTGFDTHARQAATHAALLTELSESLAAFQRDLTAQGASERVATLVFSEFGRRVEENGSKGTDHGAAAPALLLGGSVRAGLHGRAPDLQRLAEGDIGFTTDFRSLYSAIEGDWLGVTMGSRAEPMALFT